MMTRVWGAKRSSTSFIPKIEEHEYSDGTKHYSFRDRFGRPSNVDSFEEAMQIVKNWGMVEVTDDMRAAGWIQ